MKAQLKKMIVLFITLTIALNYTSCKSVKNANNKQKGSVIGAASGAVLGGILGNNLGKGGKGTEGAVLGGVIGGAAGVLIGNKMDKQSPSLGYLPGQLPWFQCEALEKEGIEVINDKITGATHIDKKLISGDSPKACDDLGKITVDALFKELGVN